MTSFCLYCQKYANIPKQKKFVQITIEKQIQNQLFPKDKLQLNHGHSWYFQIHSFHKNNPEICT